MSFSIHGIEDIDKVLSEIAPKHARNLSRALMQSLASDIAKGAKKLVPTRTGNLKKAIKAKRRRSKPDQPISDVIVESGKNKAYDGFYWRFVEYGTGGDSPSPEQPFLRPSLDRVQANMPTILEQNFRKKLIGMINREKKKADSK